MGVRVCTAETLEDMPIYWREAASVLMKAEQIVNDTRRAENGKT